MIRRTSALVTLISFLIFSWSCVIHGWRKTSLQAVKPEQRERVKISAVQIRSGEKIKLKKNPPARIQGDSVVGTRLVQNMVLEKSTIITHPRALKTGSAAEIRTRDGVSHRAHRISGQDDSSVTYEAYFAASIPLADIDFIWVEKTNLWATLLLDVVLPVGIVLAFAAVGMSGFNMSMGSWSGSWFGGF